MAYEPVVPEGQHLGDSRMVDGAKVGHLFDDETNELVGHAAWREAEDEPTEVHVHNYYEPQPSAGPAPEPEPGLVEIFATLALAAATPYVVRWLDEKAVSPVRAKWKRVSAARKAKRRGTVDTPVLKRTVAFIASPTGVEIAARAPEVHMSRAEWQERVQAAMAAGAFRDEQMRILANARIDDDTALDAADATEELTAQQFAERIGLLPAPGDRTAVFTATRPTTQQKP